MRTPSASGATPPWPRNARLYVMRYDCHGETVSRLFHFRSAAERSASLVEDRGGVPLLYVTEATWRAILRRSCAAWR